MESSTCDCDNYHEGLKPLPLTVKTRQDIQHIYGLPNPLIEVPLTEVWQMTKVTSVKINLEKNPAPNVSVG